MQNQTQAIETKHVADIIKVMNGGIEFYEKAKQEVDSPRVERMFNKMIEAKEAAVSELQPFAIAEKGHIEEGSNLEVEARQAYTKLLDKVTKASTEHTYVDQLEEVEDKVLEELDEALKLDQPSGCERALRAVQARMRECHDEMKALQMTTH
ncbi:PA2169 family four-helix-bundle protein [Marinomonas ostreistagni]|uniref:PA2169 family four-helix-bundle protein n=1 Tax=Marinomonas ostreistagni TaxID=359209 RepID=A0ABS0ZG23_9GAMM|nr:PA2169 family four-helix-bundle protein [Marinomonas ostreistagni]MBJ7552613.1 PA2169 family four-helix-bundle protein [Marinomonas ostreistagni]